MDINYTAIILAYGLFGLTVGGTLFLFVRSFKDGYWGKHSEDIKYQVFDDRDTLHERGLRHDSN